MDLAPDILVIHGALGSAAQMAPVAKALETLGTVHVVELPGHGTTPLGEGEAFSIDAFATEIASLLHAVAGPPPVVFGYSMGGYVALALEARVPGTFHGIVTAGTKLDWSPEIAVQEASRLDADSIAERAPRFAELLAARHREAGGWRVVIAHTVELMRSLGEDAPLSPSVLAGITAPVRMLIGSRDDTVSATSTHAATTLMPDVRITVLDGIPHPVERLPMESVAAAVIEILPPRRARR